MAKFYLSQANKLDIHLAAIIALPGNPVRTAISVYSDFTDMQKEHALQHSGDLLTKALELQDKIREFIYLYDGFKSNTKVSLRYLGIDEDEIIKDDELLIILNNKIAKKEEEIRDWLLY